MEMQKKNEDLCSKLESDLPTGGLGAELNDFEGMQGQNMLNTNYGDNIEPEPKF